VEKHSRLLRKARKIRTKEICITLGPGWRLSQGLHYKDFYGRNWILIVTKWNICHCHFHISIIVLIVAEPTQVEQSTWLSLKDCLFGSADVNRNPSWILAFKNFGALFSPLRFWNAFLWVHTQPLLVWSILQIHNPCCYCCCILQLQTVLLWTGKSYWGGRLSTVDLLVQTSLDSNLYKLKILFTFFTKQATLMRRSTVLSLPPQLVSPAVKIIYWLLSNLPFW
jgi:hypothetical protein